MIHEDDDEIDKSPINFLWIYFICRTKLNLTDKESGRLTYRQFRGLYRAYCDTFDTELYLTMARKTYHSLREKARADEEWL